MEIPEKIRKQIDYMYEAPDNIDFVIDYKGQYLPKKGNKFIARHIHHIDQNRANNELWNLIPLSYDDHIIQIHSKNNLNVKKEIYYYIVERYPEHEEHYRKYLLDKNKKN